MRLAWATGKVIAAALLAAALPCAGAAAAGGRGSSFVVPVVTEDLLPALGRYTVHTEQVLRRLAPQLTALEAEEAAGNLPASESDWVTAHMTWLDLGQDDGAYGAFGELGQQIDGLAAGLPGTTSNRSFTGFHKVEFDLWREHDTARAAADTAVLAKLVAQLTPHRVQSDLGGQPVALDSWVLRPHEILEDGLRDSLTQNDDYGSDTDLASLMADVTATRAVLDMLAPVIDPRASYIVPEASAELSALEQAIKAAGDPEAPHNLVSLPLRVRQQIDSDTGAAVETIAPVSELLHVTAPGA